MVLALGAHSIEGVLIVGTSMNMGCHLEHLQHAGALSVSKTHDHCFLIFHCLLEARKNITQRRTMSRSTRVKNSLPRLVTKEDKFGDGYWRVLEGTMVTIRVQ